MKVMLTPPDLWGSTGYIGAAGGAGGSSSGGSEQLYKERTEMDVQWGLCNSENKESENILLLNRQRQVGGLGSDDCVICISSRYPQH